MFTASFSCIFLVKHHRLYWAPNATRPHSVVALLLAANVPLPGDMLQEKVTSKEFIHHKISSCMMYICNEWYTFLWYQNYLAQVMIHLLILNFWMQNLVSKSSFWVPRVFAFFHFLCFLYAPLGETSLQNSFLGIEPAMPFLELFMGHKWDGYGMLWSYCCKR